ncbi:Aspartate--tRNA ligase [Candidatus Rubidus massiliensis]|nr:Aspartate--tRNA ligase [Candidatus Rubidus massiliensis]
MLDYRRTHDCGQLRREQVGQNVNLSGWVHRRRDHGGLIFVDLRDRYGLTQLVFDPNLNPQAHKVGEKIRSEYVITISGTVRNRQDGMVNTKLATGEIEVYVDNVEVLSKAKTPPFAISDEQIDVNEELRLKYRYLDIRRGDIAQKLMIRHKVMYAIREFLNDKDFLEITTPILGKSTPEGARDYLVPSRITTGSFFALPQSPQIFKQILMVAGLDRYFQIAQCFRDEDLRADRQPEFTQIDMEMSFGKPDDLMLIIEELFKYIFKKIKNIDLNLPFKRMTYHECINLYGCDRPDLRYGMELFELSDIAKESHFSIFQEQIENGGIVKGLCVKGGSDLSRKNIEEYTQFVGQLGIKGLAWMKYQDNILQSNIVKYFSEESQKLLIKRANVSEGDLIFMIADSPSKVNQGLDHLRRKLAKDRKLIQDHTFEFLWVTDFPLFQKDVETGRLVSEHHPFTSPNFEDLHLIDSNPLQMRSYAYDLVLNGYEIGGGSQRIHDNDLQKKIFTLLNLSEDDLKQKFGFFIEALSYGTPPHLGLALGLDRIVMILTNTENIKDVIAFPKTQKASDLMLECPSKVAEEQLKDLKIKVQNSDLS